MYEFYVSTDLQVTTFGRLAHGRTRAAQEVLFAAYSLGNRVKNKKKKSQDSATVKNMTSIQGRLEDLLQQGRRLRQQIESIAADVDFPLTRESDGDPRLRASNPSRPDPLTSRGHERADDHKQKTAPARSVRARSRGRTGHT
jgi:hypothetical protein